MEPIILVPLISEDEVRLLAWFHANGNYQTKRYPRIYQSREKGAKRVRKLLQDLNYKYSESNNASGRGDRNEVLFRISSRSASSIRFYAPKKHDLSAIREHLTNLQVSIFLEELIQGKGSLHPDGKIIAGHRKFLTPLKDVCGDRGIQTNLRGRGEFGRQLFISNESWSYLIERGCD